MIYGANGYTGRLIARQAVRRGQRPVLAGRNGARIEMISAELKCPSAVFALDSAGQIAVQLKGIKLVLNCAGPFSATARLMMDACLAAGVHYLDITGEIEVIEAAAERHRAAIAAGVSVIPAVGFDVVPSDCLAAMLAAELPGATHLQLAFADSGGVSPGTAKTMIETLPRGGRARIDGQIQRVPIASKERKIPFSDRARWCMTIPWGDVASAYHSTGILNIEVYTALPRRAIRWIRRARFLTPLAGLSPIQKLLKWRIEKRIAGPSAEARSSSRAHFWGQASDANGRSRQATLQTPGGYQLTMLTALLAVEKTLAGQPPAGFCTPSAAFGKELILEVPGVSKEQPPA